MPHVNCNYLWVKLTSFATTATAEPTGIATVAATATVTIVIADCLKPHLSSK